MAAHYEAFWIPGLLDDIERDESLALGFGWLREAERKHGKKGVVVMYGKNMIRNAPPLEVAAREWEFVSPRSHARGTGGPVLAIWPPDGRTLEYAERLASGTALCVIPGSLSFDIAPWIQRTGARGLVEGFTIAEAATLPEAITTSLDSILRFGGHNSFVGGGEKELAIPALRKIARRRDAPNRSAIEGYVRASGQTDAEGAERIGTWYQEIQDGKRHRDYRGRSIR